MSVQSNFTSEDSQIRRGVPPHEDWLSYAWRTNVGKIKLSNEDALCCDVEAGLFLVSDGLGGLPAGEAASQVVAHAFKHLIRRSLAERPHTTAQDHEQLLSDTIVALSRRLYEHSQTVDALRQMGATLVAVLIQNNLMHVAHLGDSRAYLLRRNHFLQLTVDHSAGSRLSLFGGKSPLLDEPDVERLLLQHMGMAETAKPDVRTIELEENDRLLICSDGLSGAVDDRTIGMTLSQRLAPEETCDTLMRLSLDAGGPDNVSLIVVDYLAPRPANRPTPGNDEPAALTIPAMTIDHVVNQFKLVLKDLEQDLRWLHDGAIQTSQDSHVASMAAAKRLLGGEAYLEFMRKQPSSNPSHVFHQFCAQTTSPWRRTYERNKAALQPLLEQVTAGSVTLSPILTADEVAHIVSLYWRDLMSVERRYFQICDRPALHEKEKSTDYLIAHMLQSVRVLGGLVDFLPGFTC